MALPADTEREKQLFEIMDKESVNLRSAAKEAYTLLGTIPEPLPEISSIKQALKFMEVAKIEDFDEAIANVDNSFQVFIKLIEAKQDAVGPDVYISILKGMTQVGQEVMNFAAKIEEIDKT